MTTASPSIQPRRSEAGIESFTALAPTYEAWYDAPLGRFIDRQEMQALASILKRFAGGSILDIGAGTGHSARWLTGWGYQVTAIEPSAAMRQEGVRRSAGQPMRWCAARAEHLPFRAASFDGALFFTSLEFVSEPHLALREAFRVVRVGGWVVVGFLHALSPWTARYRYRADHGDKPWTAGRFWARNDIEQCVGTPAELSASAVHLAPQAAPPFEDAERAGQRAGNAPALELLLWSKTS